MKIPIITYKGEKTNREIELPNNVFGIEPNDHVVYLAVKHYNANQRQGTAKTKERKGSTAKLYKQKGTGNARKGSIKSPILRGGGTIFGPRPRNYQSKLNKKTKLLSHRSVLSSKAQGGHIIVLEDFELPTHKTKEYQQILNNLHLENKKTLLITPKEKKNIQLAAQNIPKAKVITTHQMNVYNMLNPQTIILFESTLPIISKKFE